MKKEVKKELFRLIVVFFLVPVYTLASLGFFSLSITLLHRVPFQFRVRQGEFPELTVFTFSGDEFTELEWTEQGREFRLNGKMYDISSIKKVNDDYVVSCKHDAVESFVANLFTFQKENAMAKDFPKRKNVRKNLSPQHAPHHLQQNVEASIIVRWICFEPILRTSSEFYEVESPPPDLFASPRSSSNHYDIEKYFQSTVCRAV